MPLIQLFYVSQKYLCTQTYFGTWHIINVWFWASEYISSFDIWDWQVPCIYLYFNKAMSLQQIIFSCSSLAGDLWQRWHFTAGLLFRHKLVVITACRLVWYADGRPAALISSCYWDVTQHGPGITTHDSGYCNQHKWNNVKLPTFTKLKHNLIWNSVSW